MDFRWDYGMYTQKGISGQISGTFNEFPSSPKYSTESLLNIVSYIKLTSTSPVKRFSLTSKTLKAVESNLGKVPLSLLLNR